MLPNFILIRSHELVYRFISGPLPVPENAVAFFFEKIFLLLEVKLFLNLFTKTHAARKIKCKVQSGARPDSEVKPGVFIPAILSLLSSGQFLKCRVLTRYNELFS